MDKATPRLLPWVPRLQHLMPHRIREILLVSSQYDAFILEEDGPLSERIFTEYSELSLPWYPGIIHASGLEDVKGILRDRRVDLVITTTRLGDTDPNRLGRAVKAQAPGTPVVLLTFSEADPQALPGGLDPAAIDHVFLWSGDTRILFAIHKLVEDWRNVEHDASVAGVPVIIMVEDSVRHYSNCLIHLYFELVQQAQSLVAEGVNNLHKLLRLRTRPKVLLAGTYEEAMALYHRYEEHVLAVITDVSYPRGGKQDPQAGFSLVEAIREDRPDLPILLQSSDTKNARRAWELRTHFVDKTSAALSREIHRFVSDSLGFGEFVFRLPDRTEIARAANMWEMEHALASVPAEAIRHHATRHHFSVWLRARGMFDLADLLRSRTLSEFADMEDVRAFLIHIIRQALNQEHEGLVTDFSPQQHTTESTVIRLGQGSIGGKARGIAFAASLLARRGGMGVPGLEVRVPRTIIIGTEEFERFIEMNGLRAVLERTRDDHEIRRAFLDAHLSDELLRDLEAIWRTIDGPLAVRSSSILEDLQFQPFSGIYATYMLPNNHPDPAQRFLELRRAIKAVWASTYSNNAQTYVENTPFMPEEEKMAVAIQEVVGERHGERFYPAISGVALSHNYYPVKGQKPKDGVALVALGLGHMVVHGGNVLRFSPSAPEVLPQFASTKDLLSFSQSRFYAVDLSRHTVDFAQDCESSLRLYGLAVAEADGTLALAGSVYSPDDDVVRDSLVTPGRRLVTFNNVLKWNAIPLAPALERLLRLVREAMGCAVEIEFAVDTGDWGRPLDGGGPRRDPVLYVLQIRPLATHFLDRQLELPRLPRERVLAHTRSSMGHGVIEELSDVVYVKRGVFQSQLSQSIATQVGEVVAGLREKKTPFMLVGPGRWGTSDYRLGVPVTWNQIAGASLIVETPLEGRTVEPSQGTHFFQNITSLNVGYLTVAATRPDPGDAGDWLDMDWLDAQPATFETDHVRHVHLAPPLMAWLDGQRGRAILLKPEAEEDTQTPPRSAAGD